MNNYMKDVELSDEQKALYDLMENTKKNIFITGKAGTGKSYLLNRMLLNKSGGFYYVLIVC